MGAGGAVAPSGTCQKGDTLRCQKNLVYNSVYKKYKKVPKIFPLIFFSLSQLKIESYFIQSV